MFSSSFSSKSHSIINYDIFLVRYQSKALPPLAIFLHSKENTFEDLKKAIIQSYFWSCQGKNCTTKYDCSCLPEVHNIRLLWWKWTDGREIRHISAPSHIAPPSHPKMGIQDDIFVSDKKKLGLFLNEYTEVTFDIVPN
jgi:hypothetical protein